LFFLSSSIAPTNFCFVLFFFFSTSFFGFESPTELYRGDFCYGKSQLVQPFYEIAERLATRTNSAVLTFDKRTCLTANGCEYHACPALLGRTENCLNASAIVFDDLVVDAVNAMRYLATLPSVDRSRLAFVGHSQGCTVVPMAANRFGNVADVVLLNGAGISIAQTMCRQLMFNVLSSQALLNGSVCNAAIGYEASQLAAANATVEQLWRELPAANQFYGRVLAGAFGSDPLSIVKMPGVNVRAPLGWWQQWFAATDSAAVSSQLDTFLSSSSTSRVLSINSPQDLQVSPFDYMALRQMLVAHKSKRAKHIIVDDTTHMMCPSSLNNGNVVEPILSILVDFFNRTAL
jgi:pimeloyl-ACP methyl ester carboxylesterase